MILLYHQPLGNAPFRLTLESALRNLLEYIHFLICIMFNPLYIKAYLVFLFFTDPALFFFFLNKLKVYGNDGLSNDYWHFF